MYVHYLITRFNLRTAEWTTTKHNERVLDKAWYENRFRLFEKYCLPSVLAQSNPNFTWCILFDTETPVNYKKRINELVKDHPNFIVLFISGMKEMGNSFSNLVKSTLSPTISFIITSRLDNDDMIHRDFIKTIQHIALNRPTTWERTIVDLRSGLQLNLERIPSEIRKVSSSFNPFISVVAPLEDNESAITRMHSEWSKEKNILVYEDQPLWVEIVHNKNKINTIKTKLRKCYKFNWSAFGMQSKLPMDHFLNVFIFNSKLWWQQSINRLKIKIKAVLLK